MISEKVGCVVVTFNRLERLKHALNAYEHSELLPKYILVVDNHSTDGTAEYLRTWQKDASVFPRYVYTLEENLGEAGGFYQGMKAALSFDADWIFVADDDAYPEQDAIGILDAYLQNHEEQAAVCTSVVDPDGTLSVVHRQRLSRKFLKLERTSVGPAEYEKDAFSIDIFSFVGVMLSKKTLKQAGLPLPGYFIQNDDTEYSIRVRKVGDIVCLPGARMIHDSPDGMKKDDRRANWKTFYRCRNFYDLEKRHFPLLFVYHLLRDGVNYGFHILVGRKREKYQLRLRALVSAVFGRLGLHPSYPPGWKADFLE